MQARRWLVLGVVLNLGVLGYFKYANFFIENLNHLAGTSLMTAEFVLPLGISFFTFTQIAFLVDTYRRQAYELRLENYSLFVSFFPHRF
jgi:alginate O-acetyltransferase complex protein AlgI